MSQGVGGRHHSRVLLVRVSRVSIWLRACMAFGGIEAFKGSMGCGLLAYMGEYSEGRVYMNGCYEHLLRWAGAGAGAGVQWCDVKEVAVLRGCCYGHGLLNLRGIIASEVQSTSTICASETQGWPRSWGHGRFAKNYLPRIEPTITVCCNTRTCNSSRYADQLIYTSTDALQLSCGVAAIVVDT